MTELNKCMDVTGSSYSYILIMKTTRRLVVGSKRSVWSE